MRLEDKSYFCYDIYMNEFKIIIKNCWSKETCYSNVLNAWEIGNPSLGQCAVTAILFQDYFGGDIYKIIVGKISHYFNMLNNEIIDLTAEQFFPGNIYYSDKKLKTRDEMLGNDDTKRRYNVLREKYEQECAKLLKINDDIYKCNKCIKMVEKFETGKTIHFGNKTDIVILGEAPANNGWRKSGVAWHDISGKLLPSGKVLKKLLNEIGYELMDTTFLEAIKCFPLKRNYLNECRKNCGDYLLEQLYILNPKIILTLGDTATKSLIGESYKNFNEVVGKNINIKIKDKTLKVIPIYHPSPVSPFSYKGNVQIFEGLKKVMY